MDKYFICLANSVKSVSSRERGDESGRCIAGVEVSVSHDRDETKVNSIILFTNQYGSRPNWIRPVGNTETGAIPIAEASHFKVFDLIKLSEVQSVADGAHSEDYNYTRIEKIAHLNIDGEFLSQMCDSLHRNNIFGTKGDSVSDRWFQRFDHSLMLIRPSNPTFYYIVKEYNGRRKKQLRCKFSYGNCVEYDLVVTDPVFKQKCYDAHDDKLININAVENYYFVASLGMALENQNNEHYKLVASVIAI